MAKNLAKAGHDVVLFDGELQLCDHRFHDGSAASRLFTSCSVYLIFIALPVLGNNEVRNGSFVPCNTVHHAVIASP